MIYDSVCADNALFGTAYQSCCPIRYLHISLLPLLIKGELLALFLG